MIDIYRFVPDDEERERISKAAGMGRDYDMDLVLATIKKVFRWLNEDCTDHVATAILAMRAIPRRDCLLCQDEIEKELDKGAIGRKIGFGYMRQEIKKSLEEG